MSPLLRIEEGDDYLITGSAGGSPRHPGWFHNLRNDPHVQVQVGRKIENRIARVAEGEERDRLWQKFLDARSQFGEYQERTDRIIPVVVLEPNHNSSA